MTGGLAGEDSKSWERTIGEDGDKLQVEGGREAWRQVRLAGRPLVGLAVSLTSCWSLSLNKQLAQAQQSCDGQ